MSDFKGVFRYELRTRILRKVLLSFVIGAVVYAITELTGQEEIWSLMMSLYIGGVTLVVQFLIEFEARLARVETAKEQHSARIERMVDDGFAKVNEATELFRMVELSALRTEAVTQLVRHAALIEPTAPPLVSRFAQAEIGRVSMFLKDLGETGNVIYEGEDRDWLLALARQVESSIDATSLTSVDAGGNGFTDGGLWTSDLGQRYLEIQRDAVQRGVTIRRVFIVLHRPDPTTDAGLASVCQMQQELGIQVRVLDRHSVPGTLRDWLFDFVLFDDALSYEVTAASRFTDTSRPTIINTRLELQPERVKGRIQRFKDLWESAHSPA
jgi:hypothetical protein